LYFKIKTLILVILKKKYCSLHDLVTLFNYLCPTDRTHPMQVNLCGMIGQYMCMYLVYEPFIKYLDFT